MISHQSFLRRRFFWLTFSSIVKTPQGRSPPSLFLYRVAQAVRLITFMHSDGLLACVSWWKTNIPIGTLEAVGGDASQNSYLNDDAYIRQSSILSRGMYLLKLR